MDDKYIGIEVLAKTVNSMTDLIDDRNNLLNMMFKKDVYNDFLMGEAAQGGMGGAGVDNISSMGMGQPDLSVPMMPARKEYVNLEEAGASSSGNVGGASPNGDPGTTQKFNQGGVVPSGKPVAQNNKQSFAPQDKPSTKSLAETGFDDTIEKNISNKLETDFKIDDRLKKAFGDSLALPIKAAAAGLAGLLSKIPPISPEFLSNVGNFVTKIGTSLGIFNQRSSSDQSSTTESQGNNLWSQVSNFFGVKNNGEGEKKETPMGKGGSTHKVHNIGGGYGGGQAGLIPTIANFFGLAKDKDHKVSGKTMMGGVVNSLQQRRRLIEAFGDGSMPTYGVNQGGTFGGFTDIMNQMSSTMNTIQSSGSFQDISKNLVTNMQNIATTTNPQSMITDLTNTVLNESNQLMNENVDMGAIKDSLSSIAKKAGAAIPNLDMESGGSMAISIVKKSPFFTEYANTAQFS